MMGDKCVEISETILEINDLGMGIGGKEWRVESGYTLASEKAVTPLQMRKIKHLTRNISRYKPSSEAVTLHTLCLDE
jgi:hypothetical protein